MHDDETKEFLDSLEELKPGETFRFKCYPGVQCFNECCADLNLVLTPYDILRLRKNLGLSSREFIHDFCHASMAQDTRFPVLSLRMSDNEKHNCPFMRVEGCPVYTDRPGACRTYPLGRATRPDGNGGIEEQYFVVREGHCHGFEESKEWTRETWLKDQGFEPYIEFNDKLMVLLARWKEAGRPLPDKMVHMVMLALYQIDDFQRFITDMKVFSRIEVPEERQKAVMEDEEAALLFGMEWLDMMLFGPNETLKPKARG